jgi:hypothetical protein
MVSSSKSKSRKSSAKNSSRAQITDGGGHLQYHAELLPVIEEEIKQVQAVFELIRIEVSDNIPETLVIERDEDAPVLELRQ